MNVWTRTAGLLAALPLLIAVSVHAQPVGASYSEAGHFFARTLRPADYGADPESWDAVQDPQSLLYVANVGGVLVHDGVSWRTIMLPNRGAVRSLAVDSAGRVFVGGYDELGYLDHTAKGIRYRSLIDSLPPDRRSFANVWATVAAPKGMYFVSSHRLFRWSDTRGMVSWPSDARMENAARLGQTVYVHRAGRGLAAVREDRLQHVPGTTRLADHEVYFMTPFGEDRLLVGTRTAGLFAFDGTRLTRLSTDVDHRLDALQLSDAQVLPDGSVALATLRGGIVWLDAEGRLLRVFDETDGLPSNDVKALFYDDQNGLWAMTANGLGRIALPAPLTYFTEADGFSGSVFQLARHDGRIYLSTSAGVYVMRPPTASGTLPRFEAIRGLAESCLALHAAGSDLLAGCDNGVYRIHDNRAERAVATGQALALYRSPSDTNRAFAGLNSGLAVLRRRGGRWRLARTIDDVRAQIRMIVEDARGNVWLGTNHGSTYRLRLGAAERVVRLDYFDRWANQRVHIFEAAGAPLFSIRYGLFRYDPTADPADPFVPDTVLGATLTGQHQNIFRLSERSNGDLLLRSGGVSGFAYRQEDSSYRWTSTALRRLPAENVYAFLAEDNGVAWIGGAGGLFRHDARVAASYAQAIPVLLRAVRLVNRDTMLYAGAGAAVSLPQAIAHRDNSMRFAYASPRFEAPDSVRYRVRLHGFESGWSAWTLETRKDYTNLPEGRYTFEVQARDVYGHLSRPATLTFRVLPPWYRTWWAYGIYTLLGLGLFAGAVQWRSARLQARARTLEAEVRARTEEVAQQKTQLEEQNAQLEAQAERLATLDAAKSRFLANLSHEFRTPLTVVLGPLEDALDRADEPVTLSRTQAQAMLRNSQRLLRLINQILDLARLEAGTLVLDPQPHDLVAFVRETVQAFTPLAERLGLALHWETDAPSLQLAFDHGKLENVLANLVSNALKFTPTGGRVEVRIASDDDTVRLAVTDTGPGIPEPEQPHVFDRFYQVDGSPTRAHEGTGIGLALARELVELHGGTIDVASTPGEGSTFTVVLPRKSEGAREQGVWADGGVGGKGEEDTRPAPIETETHVPASPAQSKNPNPKSKIDRTTVLVVDDNADVRNYVRSILESDYRVLEAPDGRAGLATAQEELPDLIIADVMMPEMDGLAFSRALKDDAETDVIPVILLTARAGLDDEVAGLETGADDYVVKPFHAAALQARVDNLIALRRRLRERLRAEGLADPPDAPPSARSVFEQEVRAAIRAHLTESDFTVEALADAVALSRSQLHRRLRDEADVTPSRLIRTVRVEEAARLLHDEAGTVSEVAYAVGFESLSHFSRSFKAHFDVPPSQYADSNAAGE